MVETASATNALVRDFFNLYPGEAARILEGLAAEEVLSLLAESPAAAAIFSQLNPDRAAQLIAAMDGDLFAELTGGMDPVVAALFISRLSGPEADERLGHLSPPLARELRELMSYPPESAGHLMDPRVVIFRQDETAEEALNRIRAQPDRRVVDLCMANGEGVLQGMLSLQEVAVAPPALPLGRLGGVLVSVQALAPREEVVELMEKQKLATLPVVDFDGRLVGVIRYDGLVEAVQQSASEDALAMVGAGRTERALSKASFAVRKRLPWLQINLGTAFLASAVVGLFENTIAQITALAVFLPVVAGQSGNTGAQALAVTMRGLALREIRVRHGFRVAAKEMLVGLINGVAVALVTALVVFGWTKSPGLAFVIGTAMVFSMVMAGLAGALIPVALTSLRQDPAQSASIILTTVTDIVGFMSFLGLATLLADRLISGG